MNSDFPIRALQPVDPKTVWNAETDPHHSRTPVSKEDMRAVLGYTPMNRRDRRKAEKLLRRQGKG